MSASKSSVTPPKPDESTSLTATPPKSAKYVQGSLMRHISIMSFSSAVGLMAIFAVDFMDVVFIAMLGKEELAAAVGFAGAILFFTTSFGIGLSIAAGALVARAAGSGDDNLARRRTTHAMIYGVFLASLFAAIVWFNLDTLVSWVGATTTTQHLAVDYLQIIIPSLPFLVVGMIGGAVLRAHGDAKRSMFATIAGAAVNGILDPILIFALNMELAGAAWASVAARVTICVVALIPLLRHYGGFSLPSLDAFQKDIPAITAIAFPAILTQFATPIGQGFVTRVMSNYGDNAVAALAIISRLIPLSFALIFTLSGSIGPIIAQNFGAQRYDRVKRAYLDGIRFSAIVVVIISLILFLLRQPLAELFSLNNESQALLFLFAGPLSLLYFFYGVIFVSNAGFNNLGYPFYSTLINWGHHTLGTFSLVLVCATFWGAKGVLIGQFLSCIVFAMLSAWLFRRTLRQAPLTKQSPLFKVDWNIFRYLQRRR